MGPENPKLTIVEFADLQCSTCQMRSPMVKEFVSQYPQKVRLIYHHFPLFQAHKFATEAAAMAEAASEFDKFWEFSLAVMALNRQAESVDELYKIATAVGLDADKLEKILSDEKAAAYQRVEKDTQLAHSIGVRVTPTFFLISNDGKDYEMAVSQNIFELLNSPKYKKLLE
jgi:protein-disulfide isomerase